MQAFFMAYAPLPVNANSKVHAFVIQIYINSFVHEGR